MTIKDDSIVEVQTPSGPMRTYLFRVVAQVGVIC